MIIYIYISVRIHYNPIEFHNANTFSITDTSVITLSHINTHGILCNYMNTFFTVSVFCEQNTLTGEDIFIYRYLK